MKKAPEDCPCVYQYLWFPKEQAPAGDRCLTIFPPYPKCASCVQGSRKGDTRIALQQPHCSKRCRQFPFSLCHLNAKKEEEGKLIALVYRWWLSDFLKCLDCGLKGFDKTGVHVVTDGCTLTNGFSNARQTEKREHEENICKWWDENSSLSFQNSQVSTVKFHNESIPVFWGRVFFFSGFGFVFFFLVFKDSAAQQYLCI